MAEIPSPSPSALGVRRLAGAVALATLIAPALAVAEAPRTMLVLDGSGSMWGAVGGRTKIEIAREVVGRVLDQAPADRALGLVAYGHNRQGDCADIELLTPTGADRAAIRAAVEGLNPRGKTPLSDAVVFAAEQLDYRASPATVVLVSDGIETCHADPCAVGAALEAAGSDLTVHVVGFDIDDPKALAELQCLAENTGGSFFPASDADDLALALEQTVVETAPGPAPPLPPARLTLRATELENGPEIETGLTWTLRSDAPDAEPLRIGPGGGAAVELATGVYDIAVERAETGQRAEALRVEARPGGAGAVTIVFDLALTASLRLDPAGAAPVNSDLAVHWEGPDREGDYVTVVPAGARPGVYGRYAYTREGDPLSLRLPAEPGAYEVRYLLGRPSRVLASAPIELTDVAATLAAPETVPAGAPFEVTWTGPGRQGDWITVVAPDTRDSAFESYAYPKQDPASLRAPLAPGGYEIRYVMAGKRIIARRSVTVTAVGASLSAPEEVSAGAMFEVGWEGPAQQGDWVTIVPPDATDRVYKSYFYPSAGPSPGTLRAPLEPGLHEIRFVQGGRKVLARRTIRVTAVAAALSAPASAVVGAPIAVDWTGPDTPQDHVTLMRDGKPLRGGDSHFYSKNGSPGALVAPIEPGRYEIVYLQNGREALARTEIEIRDAVATLDGPGTVIAGAPFAVAWSGPAAKGDFVTIVAPDAPERASASYAYAANGSPAALTAPLDAGAHELRYVLRGKRVLARRAIMVEAATATLDAPDRVAPGAAFEVVWSGPAGKRDLVTIATPEQKPHQSSSYHYARNGSPARLTAPKTPGTWELRYVLDSKKVIARQTLIVGP